MSRNRRLKISKVGCNDNTTMDRISLPSLGLKKEDIRASAESNIAFLNKNNNKNDNRRFKKNVSFNDSLHNKGYQLNDDESALDDSSIHNSTFSLSSSSAKQQQKHPSVDLASLLSVKKDQSKISFNDSYSSSCSVNSSPMVVSFKRSSATFRTNNNRTKSTTRKIEQTIKNRQRNNKNNFTTIRNSKDNSSSFLSLTSDKDETEKESSDNNNNNNNNSNKNDKDNSCSDDFDASECQDKVDENAEIFLRRFSKTVHKKKAPKSSWIFDDSFFVELNNLCKQRPNKP